MAEILTRKGNNFSGFVRGEVKECGNGRKYVEQAGGGAVCRYVDSPECRGKCLRGAISFEKWQVQHEQS